MLGKAKNRRFAVIVAVIAGEVVFCEAGRTNVAKVGVIMTGAV